MIKITVQCEDANGEMELSSTAQSRSCADYGPVADLLWKHARNYFVDILREQLEIAPGELAGTASYGERELLAHHEAFSDQFVARAIVDFYPGTCSVKETIVDLPEDIALAAGYCVRACGHDGPCNGLPRKDCAVHKSR